MPDPLLEALCLAAWSQPVSLICCQDSVAPPCHWRTQKNYPTLANTSRPCGLLCLESPQLPDKTLLTVIDWFFFLLFLKQKVRTAPSDVKKGQVTSPGRRGEEGLKAVVDGSKKAWVHASEKLPEEKNPDCFATYNCAPCFVPWNLNESRSRRSRMAAPAPLHLARIKPSLSMWWNQT